jgi:hypothetical protein
MNLVQQSTTGQPVTQPTAQQMLRTFQAYTSIINCLYVHPVHRTISVNGPVVQLRLSVITITALVVTTALVVAVVQYLREPRDSRKQHMYVPQSQFDWVVQASQEHFNDDAMEGYSTAYVTQHGDLRFAASTTETGTWKICITTRDAMAGHLYSTEKI